MIYLLKLMIYIRGMSTGHEFRNYICCDPLTLVRTAGSATKQKKYAHRG